MIKKLAKSEKRILVALAKYPDLKDSEIADKIGMERSNFCKVKKRVVNKGLLVPLNIINFDNIPQAKIIVFLWAKYTIPDFELLKQKILKLKNKYPSTFVNYYSKNIMFSIAYFKSFEEAQEGKLDFTKEIGKFIEEFNWEILPNSHVKK